MAGIIAWLRRHPVLTAVAVLLIASLGSRINAELGGFLVLAWVALVIFFIADRRHHRTTRSAARPLTLAPAPSGITASPEAHGGRVPIPPKLRFDVLTRDHYTCQYCGAKGPQAGGVAVLEIDHRLPVALGGANDPVNLVTACADCNRGKGATRLDGADDPGRTVHEHQWETGNVSIRMEGDLRRQAITVSAMRYGAGKSSWVVRPKTFTFQVSLPPGGIHRLPSLEAYTLLLKEKDRGKLENFLDQMDAMFKHNGWQQTSKREWRRIVR